MSGSGSRPLAPLHGAPPTWHAALAGSQGAQCNEAIHLGALPARAMSSPRACCCCHWQWGLYIMGRHVGGHTHTYSHTPPQPSPPCTHSPHLLINATPTHTHTHATIHTPHTTYTSKTFFFYAVTSIYTMQTHVNQDKIILIFSI